MCSPFSKSDRTTKILKHLERPSQILLAQMARRSTRVVRPVTTQKVHLSETSEDDTSSPPPRKKASGKKVKHESQDIEDMGPPPNWQVQFEALREFRRTGPPAPVDTMGCDIHEHIDPKTKRLHCLVSLMLSAQCKDEANALVMAAMKRTLPNGLNLQDLLDIEQEDLALLIRPAGMHNNKSRFLKRVAVILRDEYDGDIPDTAEGMMALPGVGPKMAMLCMGSAWNKVVGIGVDVHVHRICNLLGWVKTNAPEKTRAALESWLPHSYWREINHLMVGHGQMTCRPIGRRCSECPLSQPGTLRCPSVVAREAPRKKIKVEVKSEDLRSPSLSPAKQSYNARFPKIDHVKRETAVKIEENPREAGERVLKPSISGEFGNDLDQLAEEKVEQLVHEKSPYFANVIKQET